MKHLSVPFMLLALASPLAAQSNIPYNSVEPKEQLNLHRDSERWIRERFRWFREHRVDVHGNVPKGVREQAWRESNSMSVYKPKLQLSKAGATAGTWVNVGPHNIGGRLTGIAIHPTNPDIVYFTAADGGVWKSVNGTSLSFEAQPISDDLPTLAMGSIDLDPNNPDIVYVGTGEANGSADS